MVNRGPDNKKDLLQANSRSWADGIGAFITRYRHILKFILNLGIFSTAYVSAYIVRFDFAIPQQYLDLILRTLPLLLIAKSLGFFSFGLFRGWWRYVSIQDVLPITAGCTLASVLFAATVSLIPKTVVVPRSIFLLDWGITLLMVLGIRVVIRIGRQVFGRNRSFPGRRVLIIGAGAAGQMIVREIRENPGLGILAVGFVDDDPAKLRTRISGVSVLGRHEEIGSLCEEHDIDEIIIAIPSASPSQLRHILDHCEELRAVARILPSVGELIDGKVSVGALRNVALEDLLGRDPVELDIDLLSRHIGGRTVMVTGAAGSIGSELCRKIARLAPARLVMFEIAESPLFEFELEMREKFPKVNVHPLIGDVRDRARVEEAMRMYQPSIVYHAAAYKHVPMMEMHPVEAVKTNVLGTRILAEAASKFGVERFVLVSTDKAVRPTNVMGATKRLAELVIHNMNEGVGKCRFVAVRFGNVLGSAGSVIPIFRRQLETTGKLTVTHQDASRYFMLISEAAGLILQAGAMGEGGEVFVLEMGEPVRIVDLAENLIRLSGKEPGVDAELVFTGLRPGEKLHEELVIEGEDVVRTRHPKVMRLIGGEVTPSAWSRWLEELISVAITGESLNVVKKLDALVKGYRPQYDLHGVPVASEEHPPGSVGPPPDKSVH
jgi:FlaA1/EpsC-like NDP-sugar epimerase